MTSSPSPRTPNIPEFWKLVAQSGLYTQQQCRDLHVRFSQEGAAGPAAGAKQLAKWLIERKYLTLYQAQVLLTGRAGPFLYGDYKLLERVEAGGLAGCFRGIHSETRYPVLLQFLAGDAMQQPAAWIELTSHLSAICAFRHPNLHRWFTWQDLDQFKFLVSEELSGETFTEVIRRGPLTPSRSCWLVQQAARGIQAMHEQGMCHGNLVPDILWMTPSHVAKVLLYPLTSATRLQPIDELIRADYQAPELVRAGQVPQAQADIYALGCTLYQLLSGRPPFPGGTVAEKQQRHAGQSTASLQRYKVRPELEQVVARLMAKNPASRCQSMSAVIAQLEPFVGDEPHLMPPSLPDRTREAYEKSLSPPAAPSLAPRPTAPGQLPRGGTPGPGQPVVVPARPKSGSRTRSKRSSSPTIRPPASVQPSGPSSGSSLTVGGAASQRPSKSAVQVAPPAARRTPARKPPSAPTPAQPEDLRKIAEVARETSRPVVRRRSTPAERYRRAGWMVGGCVLLLLLIGILWSSMAFWRGDGGRPAEVAPSPAADTGVVASTGNSRSSSGRPASIPDDGVSLWASPTDGPSLDLRGVPPESLLTVVLRPADILQHPEGSRVLRALGPAWQQWEASFREATNVPLIGMERLVISLHDRGSEVARAAYNIRLVEPMRRSDLLALWGNPSELEEGDESLYVSDDWAIYCWEFEPAESSSGGSSSSTADSPSSSVDSRSAPIESVAPPRGDLVRSFVCGPAEEIRLVAVAKAAPPIPQPRTEQLIQASDGRRMMNVLFVPQFWRSNFLRDGREYYFGDARPVRLWLDWLVGDGLRAGVLSLHLDEETFYSEVKLLSEEHGARIRLAADFQSRFQQLPDVAENYLAREIHPLEYWRIVAFRYPLMLQFLADHSRVQVENGLIVMNAILPSAAAHNLLFASEVLLASSPGSGPAEVPAGPSTGPTTIDSLLEERITLRFDQLALEAALAAIVSDIRDSHPNLPIEFDIKIMGDDFEKGGITRNQQIVNFNKRDATVSDVLTAIVQMANPITTVGDPSESDQKLIWVVAPDPDRPARTIVLLTTREGAAQREWPLPTMFRSTD